MQEEYDSIMWNNVWEVVPRPEGKSVVTSRWLYKIKYVADGSIEKHKARFVAIGFSQVEAIDYDETFAPVARYTFIKSIMAIATEMGLASSLFGVLSVLSLMSTENGEKERRNRETKV
jgi:hypothetical protein